LRRLPWTLAVPWEQHGIGEGVRKYIAAALKG
jgi:hypothetical protein